MSKMDNIRINEAAKDIFGRSFNTDELAEIMSTRAPDYESWLATLPSKPILGVMDECWQYAKCWGNGGGAFSTQKCAQEAADAAGTDIPGELANKVLDALEKNGVPSREASIFVMGMINDSLAELSVI